MTPAILPSDVRFPALQRLQHMVREANLEGVQQALAQGAPADGVLYERFRALNIAAEHGNIPIAQALLNAGASTQDSAFPLIEPILHTSLAFEHDEFFLWWLDQPGVNLLVRNAQGLQALHIVAVRGATDLGQRLLERGATWSERSGPLQGMETLHPKGCTPYELAALHGNTGMMVLLERLDLLGTVDPIDVNDAVLPRNRL